jgi:hypothetical protein
MKELSPRTQRALTQDVNHAVICSHLHDTTTRYDRKSKVLTFLLVCSVCGTQKVVEELRYEPAFAAGVPSPNV